MFNSIKPLSYIESRIANFPKATKISKTIECVDYWGKKQSYTVEYTRKDVNLFDGFATIKGYPFIAADHVGIISNWFTNLFSVPHIDMFPSYVVRSEGSWYASYKDGHTEEAVPSRKERVRLAKHNSNLRPDGDYDGDYYDKYNNLYGTFWK